jgi:signal transduction histidine kinase
MAGRGRRWPSLTLRTKLTLLIEGLMLALGLATGVIATIRTRAMLESEFSKRGLAIAADLAMFSVKPLLANDLATLRRFVNHSMSQDHVRAITVLDADGAVVMDSNLGRLQARLQDALSLDAVASADGGYHELRSADGRERHFGIHYPITASGARLGTVVLTYSLVAVENEIASAGLRILLIWIVLAAAAGVLAFLLATYIAAPITRIADAMRHASTGEVRVRLDVRRSDEIGALAASFNQMADDLAAHRKHLQAMVEARTAALTEANARLESEIAERARAESDVRQSRQELRNLAVHLESVREQERAEIAREIHDELGQSLTALKLDVHWVGRKAGAKSAAVAVKTRAMSAMIDDTMQSVRRISSELRPKLLDDLGLSAALEWQAREFERHAGIACDIRSQPDDIVIDQARSTALFRIFQETLTNVARHAGATRVEVSLSRDGADAVEMVVQDDGRGITPERVADARSLGIIGMKERVRSLNGTIEFISRPGAGTTVRVSLPAQAEGA